MIAGCVVNYMLATHKYEQTELSFRAYITESVRLIGENKVFKKPWIETLAPQHTETRSVEEIVSDVVIKAGLVVRDESVGAGGQNRGT